MLKKKEIKTTCDRTKKYKHKMIEKHYFCIKYIKMMYTGSCQDKLKIYRKYMYNLIGYRCLIIQDI